MAAIEEEREEGRKIGEDERRSVRNRRNKNCRVENDRARKRKRDNLTEPVPFPFTGIVMSRVGIN